MEYNIYIKITITDINIDSFIFKSMLIIPRKNFNYYKKLFLNINIWETQLTKKVMIL